MRYRKLGKSELKISEIGFGTWQLTNDPGFWTGSDPNQSLRCLENYVVLGGNFIDTAWIYGYSGEKPNQHPSEELIGKFLRESGKRDKVIIATKVPPKNMKWPAWKGIPIEEVFPSQHIETCVNDSLRSLDINCIDLMQFHVWQDDFVNDDNWKKTVQKMTKEGKIRYWGISVNDYQPSNCLRTLETGLISSIQCIFNIFHQKPIEKLFKYARINNIGLIARVPLDEGGLSGKFNENTVFAEGDFRSSYFMKDRLKELKMRNDKLMKFLNDDIKSLAELSLRFILSFKEISTLIVGMRKLDHVKLNTSYSDKKRLSSNLIRELKKHFWERNFYPDVDPLMNSSNFIEK